MMFWLGLIVAVCYVPGYTGAFIPTQWAFLSLVLPLGLWRSGPIGLGHLAGLVALAWSALSIIWAPNALDWGQGMWMISILGLALWLGSTTEDLSPIFRGLAVGLTVSSALAVLQAFGFTPVEAAPGYPAGLLYNSTVLGAACALVLIALCVHRLWWYIPGLLPALALSQSRGAFVVLACVTLATRIHWTIVLTLGAIAFGLIAYSPGPSDIQRLYLWGITLRQLDFLGHGIGSFNTFLYYNPIDQAPNTVAIFHPEFVHNDFLQLWFELGLGAIGIYFIHLIALTHRQSPYWPVFFGFFILSFFFFPLYCPILGFIGALIAGRLVTSWHLTWLSRADRRLPLILRPEDEERSFDQLGCHPIPPKP